MSDVEGGSATTDVAQRVLAVLQVPFVIDDITLSIGASIGVAERGADTVDEAELLRHADFAMYMAKGGGKGRYELYDAQMHDSMVDRTSPDSAGREAASTRSR